MISAAQPSKEPESATYMLWVDLYDLVNCNEAAGKPVYAQATIGKYQTERRAAKYNSQTGNYRWVKIQMPEEKVHFPMDLEQTPDIIVNFYTESLISGEYRFAYIRLPVTDCTKKYSSPQWHRLKSPYNDS